MVNSNKRHKNDGGMNWESLDDDDYNSGDEYVKRKV